MEFAERERLLKEGRIEELRWKLAEEKRCAARERARRTLRIELSPIRVTSGDTIGLENAIKRIAQRADVVKVELNARITIGGVEDTDAPGLRVNLDPKRRKI